MSTTKNTLNLGAERLQLRSELDEAREEAEGRRLEAWFTWWRPSLETKRVDRLLLIDGGLDRGNPPKAKGIIGFRLYKLSIGQICLGRG